MYIQDMTIDSILQAIGVDINAYNNALQVSKQGKKYHSQTKCPRYIINQCNRDILILWGGSMDLQPVTDDVATVMYVYSYVIKGEKVMGETLKNVAKECRNDDIHTQMNKIRKEFLGKRVFASPESSMRILSMWLMKKM